MAKDLTSPYLKHAITIPAVLHRFSDLSDGGSSMTFHTQEAEDETFMRMRKAHRKFGVLYFCPDMESVPDPITAINPDIMDSSKRRYSKSELLRHKLWAIWKKTLEGDIEWEIYYNSMMDKIINQYDDIFKQIR
jgi:hypothetical protein